MKLSRGDYTREDKERGGYEDFRTWKYPFQKPNSIS